MPATGTPQVYANLAGRFVWNSAITNDGSRAILCGRNVRVYDCDHERLLPTIIKAGNATVALSHDENTVWLDWMSQCGYDLQIYSTATMEPVREVATKAFTNIAFSENEDFCFICSASFLRVKL